MGESVGAKVSRAASLLKKKAGSAASEASKGEADTHVLGFTVPACVGVKETNEYWRAYRPATRAAPAWRRSAWATSGSRSAPRRARAAERAARGGGGRRRRGVGGRVRVLGAPRRAAAERQGRPGEEARGGRAAQRAARRAEDGVAARRAHARRRRERGRSRARRGGGVGGGGRGRGFGAAGVGVVRRRGVDRHARARVHGRVLEAAAAARLDHLGVPHDRAGALDDQEVPGRGHGARAGGGDPVLAHRRPRQLHAHQREPDARSRSSSSTTGSACSTCRTR